MWMVSQRSVRPVVGGVESFFEAGSFLFVFVILGGDSVFVMSSMVDVHGLFVNFAAVWWKTDVTQ